MIRQIPSSPVSVLCVAAPSDTAWLAKWERHLTPLVQARHITLWSEQHIMAGTLRMQQIHDHLEQSDLIVLLVSAAFFADDECAALMERAIKRAERNEARLIPLLLRPVAWRESMLALFPCIPSNNRPVTEWLNRDAAFHTCVQDIRRLLGRPITAPLTDHYTHREVLQDQNRVRMLRRVRAIWIDGLLTQSLHHEARLELHLQDRPDVLENPLRLQVQELNQSPKNLPEGTSIVDVYNKAEGELLILGEPGAGKTTLLLELARTLLERAEHDERQPMPVVFHLSSWAEKRQLLGTWLVEELWRIYQVPRKIGQVWIDADHILPLFDGLDEVAKDARSACVDQINAYYQRRLEHGNSSIVVCCRCEDYDALPTRVKLQHAVSILPLKDEQINAYLEQMGEQVKGLRQALDEDAELHSLALQPLMLNIFTLAYRGVTSAEIPTGETREEMQHTIFSRYIEGMLKRRGQSKQWKPELVIHWLAFLAKQMQRHDQTVFSVENLQPGWLSKRSTLLYQWCVGLLFALEGLLFGLITGLFGGLLGGLVSALLGGLLFAMLRGSNRAKIDPAEALTWSWKGARLGLVGGLLVGLLVGPFYALADGLLHSLLFGLCAGLVVALLVGISGRKLSEHLTLSPNEGIWRSGKSGLLIALLNGFLFALLFGLIGGPILGLFVGLAMPLLFVRLGGTEAFIKHFVLRYLLYQRKDFPWDLIAFLDEAAARLLLRKVGGSYIFVHRQLLDYFARL